MITLNAALSQHVTPANLPAAVRAALGKPLRRAAPLTQLALVGALACLPEERRHLPTALLWQSTSGPRQETLSLLDEVCTGSAEPMPYDFLATQPAMAAAQIQAFLPGLQSAMHLPLNSVGVAHWALLLSLAIVGLNQGRYTQVLCAQLDHAEDIASGHWLALSSIALENSPASLHLSTSGSCDVLPDVPDFPKKLAEWLATGNAKAVSLQSPVAMSQTVEFARL